MIGETGRRKKPKNWTGLSAASRYNRITLNVYLATGRSTACRWVRNKYNPSRLYAMQYCLFSIYSRTIWYIGAHNCPQGQQVQRLKCLKPTETCTSLTDVQAFELSRDTLLFRRVDLLFAEPHSPLLSLSLSLSRVLCSSQPTARPTTTCCRRCSVLRSFLLLAGTSGASR